MPPRVRRGVANQEVNLTRTGAQGERSGGGDGGARQFGDRTMLGDRQVGGVGRCSDAGRVGEKSASESLRQAFEGLGFGGGEEDHPMAKPPDGSKGHVKGGLWV